MGDVSIRLPHRRSLKGMLNEVFTLEKTEVHRLDYVFCSDEYLHQLNLEYLNHDTLTDILTFTLSGPGEPVEGEIYISTERVEDNARIHQTTFENELHRVMVHGILHLCGYEDHTPGEKTAMRKKEDHYLKKLAFS